MTVNVPPAPSSTPSGPAGEGRFSRRRQAVFAAARSSASDAPHAQVSGTCALWYTRSHRGQTRASGSYEMTLPLAAQCRPTTCGGSSARLSPASALRRRQRRVFGDLDDRRGRARAPP